MPIRFLWLGKLLECLCFNNEASLPTYIFNLSIPLVSKEDFAHFLKCHNKAWFRPAMQPYARQSEHHRHKHRWSNTSWRSTKVALKGGEKEIRASCRGWSESSVFLNTKFKRLISGSMLALKFSSSAYVSCLFLRLHRRSEQGLTKMHGSTTYAGILTEFGFTSPVKTVTYILLLTARGFLY